MVISNTADIVKVMTSFYKKAFREITTRGFDLCAMDTVKEVLSEQHLFSLRTQIAQMQTIEQSIEQELPSVSVLEDFMSLLLFLRGLSDQNPSSNNKIKI